MRAASSAAKAAGSSGLARVRQVFFRSFAIGLAAVARVPGLIAAARWTARMQQSVTLLNATVLAGSFDRMLSGRDDLLAADGRTLVARDGETVGFNDRYVWIWSYDLACTGLYDALAGARLDGRGDEEIKAIGLGGGTGCAGYDLGMVGPGLLHDGNEAPFLPSCAWRNIGDKTLKKRNWFDRPCIEGGRR